MEWWSGADPVSAADKTSENARSRLLRHYARHRRSITPTLHHSVSPFLHRSNSCLFKGAPLLI
jgi:hypothetical protein